MDNENFEKRISSFYTKKKRVKLFASETINATNTTKGAKNYKTKYLDALFRRKQLLFNRTALERRESLVDVFRWRDLLSSDRSRSHLSRKMEFIPTLHLRRRRDYCNRIYQRLHFKPTASLGYLGLQRTSI